MHITNLGLHQVSFQSGDSYKGAEETGKHKGVSVISYQRVKNGEGNKGIEALNRLYLQNQTSLTGKSLLFARDRAEVFCEAIKLAGGDTSKIKAMMERLDTYKLGEVNKRHINELNKVISEEIRAQLGIKNKKELQTKIKQIFTDYLNNKNWGPVDKNISHHGKNYGFQLTPASHMKIGNKNIFVKEYNGKGICCASTRESDHIANMWLSKVVDDEGKEIFSGIRHGVISAYGLKKNSSERAVAARNKAEELVSAALYSRPELLSQALSGKTVDLKIVSTSLLTPTSLTGGEESMLKDQVNALKGLNSKRGEPTKLLIRNSDGLLKEVSVNLKVVTFNFGVNELALKMGLGWRNVDKLNDESICSLLGDNFLKNGVIGGWAAEAIEKNPPCKNDVIYLANQIKEIVTKKLQKNDNGEPYKLSQRMTLLAYTIGAVPCWNCKSGKDRTGMQDAEIKREIIRKHETGQFSQLNSKLSSEEKRLFSTILMNSGNMEIQEMNTGVPGNKVMKKLPLSSLELSYSERIGDPKIWNMVKGYSSFV
ncbi:type III secretion system effector inositol phosphate phosphatase [Escherichia coli]